MRCIVKSHRIAAGVMGLLLLAGVLLSALCLIAESDHDCAGEDCLLCACVRQCESLPDRAAPTGTLSRGLVCLPLLTALAAAIAAAASETPVSRKIRLNN